MAMVPTTVRIDDKKKKELEKQLKEIDMSVNGYIRLAINQFLIQKKIPFDIVTPEGYIPNLKTKIALKKAEEQENGKVPYDSPVFDNVNDLFSSLDNDDAKK